MHAIDDVSIISFSENLFLSQVSQCNLKNVCNELEACRTREERAQQNASRDSLLSHFLSYAANFSEKFALRGLEETIKHVSYFSPREANSTSFAAIVRIWPSPIHRSSNKTAWPTQVTIEHRVQDGGGDGKGVYSGRSFTSTQPSLWKERWPTKVRVRNGYQKVHH